MSALLTLLFAVTCGGVVANIYYSQPLLAEIAAAFHLPTAQAGLLVTITQIGYASGLALLVPLGDALSRRRLTIGLCLLTSAALLAAAFSPSYYLLCVAMVCVGLSSCAVQVLVPFAASLAPDAIRGKVVGTVMSGLLLGILLARTVSGLIAGTFGWRAVYLFAFGAMTVLIALLVKFLPADPSRPRTPYLKLLSSAGRMALTDPVLRERSFYGALAFAAFSLFWTGLTFVLSAPPYSYSQSTIGLFGLAGAAGALAASGAGRLADSGGTRLATGLFGSAILASYGLIWLGGHSLAALIGGVLVLDVGVQGLHITNQSVVYRGNAEARSRITTVYLTSYFIGGAAGSLLASTCYAWGGWGAVSCCGAAIGAIILLRWLPCARKHRALSAESI
ncbi:MFS transporter [Geomesophilobacter sediminis]|uniref:MFS transporter n=1 Tax=Geomesophilobacter sediminis TaxID=2798584 RepID=A0A8J7LVE8_9BACT|nr:MFS transporter [Geomesophilobacter sediminis]MBJ6724930.1 MFS transporter [Geomesophilobacter sediminis]